MCVCVYACVCVYVCTREGESKREHQSDCEAKRTSTSRRMEELWSMMARLELSRGRSVP